MQTSNFNKSYANKVSKDQWIKDHLHHGTEAELGAKYDELQEQKPAKDHKKAAKAES